MATKDVINPYWDIFANSIDDKSIESYEMIKWRTKQAIVNAAETDNTTTNINIEIDDLESYYLPSKGYLEVKCKLVNDAAGADLAGTDVTTLASNGLALFRKANYRISGMEVEESQELAYSSLASGFVHLNKANVESISDSQWFYPEKAHVQYGNDNDQATNPLVAKVRGGGALVNRFIAASGAATAVGNLVAARNPSYEKRFARTFASSEIQMQIPLERIFGFCRDYKSVLKGVRHEFQFDRQTQYAAVVHSLSNIGLTVRPVILEMNIWMPRLRPSIEALATIEQELNSAQPAKILYNSWSSFFTPDYPAATTTVNYRLPPVYGKPTKCFVGIQNLAKYTNQADLGAAAGAIIGANGATAGQNAVANPLSFIAGGVGEFGTTIGIDNINNMVLRINGQPFPLERYELNFNSAGSGDLYGRAYSEFLRICGKSPYGDESSIVDHKTYKYIYPLLAFDLEQNLSGYKKGDSAEIEVQAQLTAGTNASNFRLVIMVSIEKEKTILPSGNRIALLDA
jgi:hypothetical protein